MDVTIQFNKKKKKIMEITQFFNLKQNIFNLKSSN